MFLVATSKNLPSINLNVYAIINRQLITSNISFMVTNLVVLMQFKLTLLAHRKEIAKIVKESI